MLRDEAKAQSARVVAALEEAGAPADLAARVVRVSELDGAVGLADLGQRLSLDETRLTHAFTRLGQALGLDWAQGQAARISPSDPWERLLIAGLARDFQQQRLDFLGRAGATDPEAAVEAWLERNAARVGQFKAVIDRARLAAHPTPRCWPRSQGRRGCCWAGGGGEQTLFYSPAKAGVQFLCRWKRAKRRVGGLPRGVFIHAKPR